MGGTPHGASEDDVLEPYLPGEPIAIREIWNGRVWYARPATVVRDEPNLTMLLVPPRVVCKEPIASDGTPLRLPQDGWGFTDTPRSERSMLSFAFPDTPYSVILGFDERFELDEYYVNLQTPLVRSPAGFDTVEHLLDVHDPARSQHLGLEGRGRAGRGRRPGPVHRGGQRVVPLLGRARGRARIAPRATLRRGLVDLAARPRLGGTGSARRLGSAPAAGLGPASGRLEPPPHAGSPTAYYPPVLSTQRRVGLCLVSITVARLPRRHPHRAPVVAVRSRSVASATS